MHQERYHYNNTSSVPRSILIKDGSYLITAVENDDVEVQVGKSILIEDGVITDIVQAGKETAWLNTVDVVYDAGLRGGIVITPGLINAHAHPPMYLLRSTTLLRNDHATTEESLEIARAIEQAMTSDDQTISALGDFTEQQKMGTTTVLSHYHTPQATRTAAKQAHIRLVDAVSAASKTDPAANMARVLPTLTQGDDMITPAITVHTLSQVTMAELQAIQQLLVTHPHLLLTMHCAETDQEVAAVVAKHGKRPVAILHAAGLLSKRLILSHAVHFTDSEIKLLVQQQVGIVHLPTSNRIHRSGQFNYATFFNLRGHHRIALGTDSVISKSKLDIVSEALQSKIMHQDTAHPVRYDTLFKMMTINGARVLGLEHELGKIAVGYKADLAFWKLKNRDFIPYDTTHPETLIGNFITHGGTNPRDLMVNGKFVISNRRHNLVDESRLLADLQQHHTLLTHRVIRSFTNIR